MTNKQTVETKMRMLSAVSSNSPFWSVNAVSVFWVMMNMDYMTGDMIEKI